MRRSGWSRDRTIPDMSGLKEQPLVGLAALQGATDLLQRIRLDHPTACLWEAADRQWSWRNERSTDA